MLARSLRLRGWRDFAIEIASQRRFLSWQTNHCNLSACGQLALLRGSWVEDIVYLGLGLLLAGSSVALLVSGMISFGQNLMARSLTTNIVSMLDRILLILLVVELLYTVQVSFREHGLIPEPFFLVGLIAGIRRVLVLTAEFAQVHDEPETVFQDLA